MTNFDIFHVFQNACKKNWKLHIKFYPKNVFMTILYHYRTLENLSKTITKMKKIYRK